MSGEKYSVSKDLKGKHLNFIYKQLKELRECLVQKRSLTLKF